MKPALPDPPPPPRGALVALSLSTALAMFGSSAGAVALPTLGAAFAVPPAQAQWVVLAYLLTVTMVVVGAGRLGDMLGRRRLLAAGLALYAVGALLCALAPTLWLLAAARAVQGAGAATMLAHAMALAGDAVPKAQLGRAMGLLGTMSAVGTASGPLCGGLLIAWADWRAIFLVSGLAAAATMLLTRRVLPAETGTAKTTQAELDRDRAAPLLDLTLFRQPGLRAALIASLLVATVMMATLVVGPYYLSHDLALDPAAVGLIIGAGPLVSATAATPAGRAVDRFGAAAMTVAGLTVALTGALGLAASPLLAGVLSPLLPGAFSYLAALAVLTGGYSLFQTANNAAVMRDVAAERRGVVAGLLNLSRNLGLIAGASAMGALYAGFGMSAAFLVAAGLIATALGVVLTGGRAAATAPAA